jgi:hypothetical protein
VAPVLAYCKAPNQIASSAVTLPLSPLQLKEGAAVEPTGATAVARHVDRFAFRERRSPAAGTTRLRVGQDALDHTGNKADARCRAHVSWTHLISASASRKAFVVTGVAGLRPRGALRQRFRLYSANDQLSVAME